jgi:hypothetical protein
MAKASFPDKVAQSMGLLYPPHVEVTVHVDRFPDGPKRGDLGAGCDRNDAQRNRPLGV